MSSLVNQFKKLKTDASAGWVSSSRQAEIRKNFMEAIVVEPAVFEKKTNRPQYFKWVLADFVSKPVMAGALVFSLLMGGSISTVNAASDSLPGDTLYSIKLVSEQAKLKLSSLDQRAILHTEFAQNRLDEAVALNASGDPVRIAAVQQTIDAYKVEVNLASDDLKQMQSTGSTQTVKVASLVDQRVTKLSSTIKVLDAATTEQKPNVQEAQQVADTASQNAVNVMVETHESNSTVDSTENLSVTFREKYGAVVASQAYYLGRLTVIRSALKAHPELVGKVSFAENDLKTMEHAINSATADLPEVMNLLAASGDYRSAFESLRVANETLSTLEAQLAGMEISITQTLSELALEAAQNTAEEAASATTPVNEEPNSSSLNQDE